MKAIQTRFLGPTNTKGARIKAWAEGLPAKTYSYDYDGKIGQAHSNAAQRYAKIRGWDDTGKYGLLHSGRLPNGDYCHVFFVKP